MPKHIIEDDLKSSPPLEYMFKRPTGGYNEYEIDGTVKRNAHLILDLVEYVKSQRNSVLNEILDSLNLLGILIEWPYNRTTRSLYDIDWSSERIDDGREVSLAPEVDSVADVVDYYNNIYAGLYALDKGKISKCPDIHHILGYLEEQDDDPKIKSVMAVLYIGSGKKDKAAAIYEAKCMADSLGPHEYYNLGTIYIETKDYCKAIDRLSGAGDLDAASYNTGVAYLRQKDWVKAFECLEPFASGLNISDMDAGLQERAFPGSTHSLGNPDLVKVLGKSIPLKYMIRQYSCNNLGVCHYRTSHNILKAFGFFESALSWEPVTRISDGAQNLQYIKKIATGVVNTVDREEKRRKYPEIVGESDVMYQKVYSDIDLVSKRNACVFIEGEKGSGKELVARAIHNNSKRGYKDLVAVDSAAIPKELVESTLFGHEKGAFTGATSKEPGKFKQANGSTIFLDEIGNMSLACQAKLLRVIQERQIEPVGGSSTIDVDVRILTATNKNLEEEISEGNFLDDLYDRINVFRISVPPLRERKGDIPLLVKHFLEKHAEDGDKPEMSRGALELLEDYEWPGNVRELGNSVESALIRAKGGMIYPEHLPADIRGVLTSKPEDEEALAQEALRKEFNEVLDELTDQGITQKAIAKTIGKSGAYITMMKKGPTPVKPAHLDKIKDAYSDKLSD